MASNIAVQDEETPERPADSDKPTAPSHELKGMPLYARILIALVCGVILGSLAQFTQNFYLIQIVTFLEEPARLLLRLLSALAPPLVLVAVVNALIHANLKGPLAGRLAGLLVLNTVVAILIGLLVANVVRPGRHGGLERPAPKPPISASITDPEEKRIVEIAEKYGFEPVEKKQVEPLKAFLENVPKSLFGPLTDGGSVLSVILIAIAFGLALRQMKDRVVRTVADSVQVAFDALLIILHWVVKVVPYGVFGIVANIIGTKGFKPFVGLAFFIGAVILALFLQAAYYLTRIAFGSWVSPIRLLKGGRDALVMAFSTASSTATMPLTYTALRERVGLRQDSASMGALVGSNFNNDGTALYEAMAALFISQIIGQQLSIGQQGLVVMTSIAASVGAAGIPEAGLVTMTLVFHSVGLPTEYIALLFTVDWFLDRCRTAINVMGDMNVSCMLDGKTPEDPATVSGDPA